MILDIYTHIAPRTFLDRMSAASAQMGNIVRRLLGVKPLFDLDVRFRDMDAVEGYRQVISLPNPSLEEICTAEMKQELARIANDEMAELCTRHPDRFPKFVAAVSLLDVDSAIDEARRAIRDLGAAGVQIYTSIAGHPLDEDRFRPFFDAIAALDVPMWLHPTRTALMKDYAAEAKSRYEMWWCFGWPYDTSVAMSRLVFSGLLDRHPKLRIITHHLGGMIPYYDGRVGPGLEVLGSRTSDEDYSQVLPSLKRPHMDYFKMFYADTAMFGASGGLRCGVDFFGSEHVVFATDAPLGPIGKTIEALHSVGLAPHVLRRILYDNGAKLLKIGT